MSDIFDSTIGGLNTSMNLRLLNQNVIASNIANADTPGYKAKRVEFERALRDALGAGNELKLEKTHPDHLGLEKTDPIDAEIYEDPYGPESLDENTVDRAREMAELAQNELMYNASAEMLRRKLGMLKYAVTEGGGR